MTSTPISTWSFRTSLSASTSMAMRFGVVAALATGCSVPEATTPVRLDAGTGADVVQGTGGRGDTGGAGLSGTGGVSSSGGGAAPTGGATATGGALSTGGALQTGSGGNVASTGGTGESGGVGGSPATATGGAGGIGGAGSVATGGAGGARTGGVGGATATGGAGGGSGVCKPGMVRVPAKDRNFMLGFTAAEAGTEWACFIGKHKVTFTYDFCMDANLVTQADYMTLMGNNPSQHVTTDKTLPVDAVNWYDAVLYCNERSKRDGLEPAYAYTSVTRTGNHATNLVGLTYDIKKNGYRLPTNAEYEYAERADTVGTYFFAPTAPADINTATGIGSRYSWNTYNSGGVSHPVGTKLPNPWGIYDLIGNVFEWENDWEGRYPTTDQVDPTGPAAGGNNCGESGTAARKMAKGGSYKTDVKGHMRISYHYFWSPGSVTREIGFRCVNTVK